MLEFKSNGKLLITGEYAVLDGAKSLAVPTTKGQSLDVSENEPNIISWKSLDENGKIWFESDFKIENGEFKDITNNQDPESKEISKRLQQLLQSAYKANSDAFSNTGFSITTRQDFNRKWGLGTSSTLVNNLAQWLSIDPYELLKESFGGSGYDIAVAGSDLPITYQITQHGPAAYTADFDPPFKDQLFFVYLNRKQNSREAIAHYRNQPKESITGLVEKISGITEQIIRSESLEEFRILLKAHETLISKAIDLPRIKTELFPDYPNLIKSLGGWGGDFVLAIGDEKNKEYFRSKGYDTILNYSDLIK
ncbi:GYDIA family GHMP kinase [Christiangramia echinicola]|uniref:Mevalonate kinase n=1 Tax=Christiangramia echinicola TaxID=279359 RepID=A0A1H1NSE9_9FLAO|nr:GYDIA family GHMP kinase [Christiangramia echinicola]SDS01901.1 Mevalonate kinase [Christiangramia echinicola]